MLLCKNASSRLICSCLLPCQLFKTLDQCCFIKYIQYNLIRMDMLTSVTAICSPTLNILLLGNEDLSEEQFNTFLNVCILQQSLTIDNKISVPRGDLYYVLFCFFCVVVFLIVHNGYNKYRLFYSDTPSVYVWDKRHIICIYCLSWLNLFLSLMALDLFVFAVTCHSYHSAHMRLKGHSSQTSIHFLLNPFCIN